MSTRAQRTQVLNEWRSGATPGLVGIREIGVQGHVMSRATRTLRHGEGARVGPEHLLGVMCLNNGLRQVQSCPGKSPPHLLASVYLSAHGGCLQPLPLGHERGRVCQALPSRQVAESWAGLAADRDRCPGYEGGLCPAALGPSSSNKLTHFHQPVPGIFCLPGHQFTISHSAFYCFSYFKTSIRIKN